MNTWTDTTWSLDATALKISLPGPPLLTLWSPLFPTRGPCVNRHLAQIYVTSGRFGGLRGARPAALWVFLEQIVKWLQVTGLVLLVRPTVGWWRSTCCGPEPRYISDYFEGLTPPLGVACLSCKTH